MPMIQLLTQQAPRQNRVIRALVLTPTRELAAQVLEDVQTYSKHVDLRSMVIFGGVKQNPQVSKLRGGIDILVATPGRLMDLQNQGRAPWRITIQVNNRCERLHANTWHRLYRIILTSGNRCDDTYDHRNIPLSTKPQG